MKTTTIYKPLNESAILTDRDDPVTDLMIARHYMRFNDILHIRGWISMNEVLPAFGYEPSLLLVNKGWYADNNHFSNYVQIVAMDDVEYIAFHNIVNLLGEVCNDEN